MTEPAIDPSLRRRVLLAAAIAMVVLGFWPGCSWSSFAIAAAAYFALPASARTRRAASTIGWLVGFSLTFLWYLLYRFFGWG